MEITIYNVERAIRALRQCADEHSKDVTDTGNIVVSSLCRDVADYLESQDSYKQIRSKISWQKL